MASAYTSTVRVAGRRRYYRGWVTCEGVTNINDTTARVFVRACVDAKTIALYGIHVDALVNGRVVASRDKVLNNYHDWANQVDLRASLDVGRGANAWNCPVQVHVYGKTVNGYGSAGGDVWATVQAYIPQRGYSQPNPPKNRTLKRVSDACQMLTWQGDYTDRGGAKPWDGIYVDRRTDGGGWQNIANLSWSATNYTDNSTSANHSYEYRLCSHGPGGNSSHVSCGTVYNTPAAPATVTISKASTSTVRVGVTGTIRNATSYEVQTSLNGGAWSSSSSYSSMPQTLSPGSGTVRVRVRACRGSLASAWAYSGTVQTVCAPNAPSVSGISAVYRSGSTVTVRWTRNHPDGTSQTAAQVEVTKDGTATTYDAGTATSYTLAPGDGSYSVRVRTKGLYDGWGAWSSAKAFLVAAPPQCWFSSPSEDGEMVASVPMTVDVEASDSTGIAAATLTLKDSAGNTLISVDVTDLSPVDVGDYKTLKNGGTYTLSLLVRGGSTLTASATRTFRCHWPYPCQPVAEVYYDDTLSAHVAVRNGDTAYHVEGTTLVGPMMAANGQIIMLGDVTEEDGSLVLGESARCSTFTVERECDDGTAVVATGVLDGQECIDRIPPLNADYGYTVTGYSESGTANEVGVNARLRAPGMALNFGRDASRLMRLDFNASSSSDTKRQAESFHFADGGANDYLPTSYPLDQQDESTSAQFSMDREGHDEFERIKHEEWIGWWRGHAGERAYGPMDFSIATDGRGVWKGTVKVSHDAFEEPANG